MNEHEHECEVCGQSFETATGEAATCPHTYDGEVCGGEPWVHEDELGGERWMRGG
jgi:hypothetical protein